MRRPSMTRASVPRSVGVMPSRFTYSLSSGMSASEQCCYAGNGLDAAGYRAKETCVAGFFLLSRRGRARGSGHVRVTVVLFLISGLSDKPLLADDGVGQCTLRGRRAQQVESAS